MSEFGTGTIRDFRVELKAVREFRIRGGSRDSSIRKIPHGPSDSNRRNYLLTGSSSTHHDISVARGGDLVLRSFLVVSRNQKMAVIVAE
ncbi:hypothetical protein [Bradyrhizobium sp.]|jgi:hypothetical protein|uniref:hypothetical protein n=1 Tax=Bradyrhizobium sp. TaxID=376 RepID=UPI0025BD5B84|nr:hypothetical protein [Bradyrhizobium sp.]